MIMWWGPYLLRGSPSPPPSTRVLEKSSSIVKQAYDAVYSKLLGPRGEVRVWGSATRGRRAGRQACGHMRGRQACAWQHGGHAG